MTDKPDDAGLTSSENRMKKSANLADSTDDTNPLTPNDEKTLSSGQFPDDINEKLLKQLTNVMLVSGTGSSGDVVEKKSKNDYRFWRTQPVPDLTEEITDNGPIEPDSKHEDIRSQPYTLPEGFYWCEVSLDDENEFNFTIRMKSKHLVEVNYLCVHKKLRSKRMAPVLIREVTRRVHLRGRFQALFTSGTLLPKPISKCRYWHRPLNPRKLLECGFSHLTHNMTLQRTIKLYRLPDAPLYLEKFSIHPIFTKEEFQHFFVPRDNVVYSFVVETEDGQITDFCSFYVLPSSVMKCKQHNSLRAAYSFYNVSTITPWPALIQDMLISAKQLQFDVFNALDLMENGKFLEELKFGIGDGDLHYYLYNWRCPFAKASEIGIVLQ
ncbi:Glycylpeptide N-tetradecanoyltransferase 1 [Schistosoma japonicum]|nr:Glycylpeptide N-tetradecanoyltransferase 1 [Schistosoma japonicum]